MGEVLPPDGDVGPTDEDRLDAVPESVLAEVWSQAFRTARRFRVPHEDAEDVAQTVALYFCRRAPEIANPRAWVRTVVSRSAHALSRKASRRRTLQEAPQEVVVPFPAVDRSLDLRRLLRALRPRDAEILILSFRGRSHREIAARLNLPVAGVGVYVARARERAARAWLDLALPVFLGATC